ncbi:hypothetical protein Nepgr_002760 [Nepenthes gracilis]|uniref:EF-hand domain-containing protein n=1 Tax=Nepenthes gracilis TaxID=150966 RepID=A0AAD3RYG4_NEPGR|nr:hypothetical protein Nepgr_002760 [Nepenthes gracilis]
MPYLNSEDLRRIFESLDRNGDSLVSLEELNWLLERTGVRTSLEDLVSLVGKPGGLNFDEFAYLYDSVLKQGGGGNDAGEAAAAAAAEEEEEGDLYEAFKVFDENDDGFISPDEIKNVLLRLGLWIENGAGEMDCRRIISVYDTNFDGLVDFEEFKRMMLAA